MAANPRKRLILCCDGTWMDSDDGYQKPTLIPYVPTGTLQIPSNVTRISRALRRHGLDGTPQIIYYHSGVGTGSSLVDTITGGLLGTGISENIREVYSFIAANWMPGDDIVLIGFSRGAFTVRSVAGMIRDIGILTREGMADFYPIFKDQENFKNPHYHDIFPTIPFPDKPTGEGHEREYRRRLEKDGLTRVHDEDGNKIHIQAVAVWDTVGALGIPTLSFLAKLGLPHSTKEYKFYDTNLHGCVRHAFQCLALDEHRAPFQAAVWEVSDKLKASVDLRQVWVPGAHSNAGGGYPDQEIANISLAWMMDQLASIGVAFQDEYIETIFNQNVEYYEHPPKTPASMSSIFRRPTKQWAITPIYEKHKPVRPWALGQIYNSEMGIYHLTGAGWRTPGFNTRADPDTGAKTNIPMTNTNERIHSCVRVRIELEGLGLDDIGLYKCHSLLGKGWRLRQIRLKIDDPIPWNATWGPGAPPHDVPPDDLRWVWEWDGPDDEAPLERIMVEENLGPYERKLLLLNRGAKYQKGYKRRRRHKARGEVDAEKGDFVQGDDGRGNINPAALGLGAGIGVAAAASRDSEKQRRRRRHKNREARSDEISLIDDRVVSPPIRDSEKQRRHRSEKDRGGERRVRKAKRYDEDEIVVLTDRTRPPPTDPRRSGRDRVYRDEEIVVIQENDRVRAPSRPPPPVQRTTPRPPSTDPSQRKYTMEDIIFTADPGGRSRAASRTPGSGTGERGASRVPPPPPSGFDDRPRAASRAPPPPPSAFDVDLEGRLGSRAASRPPPPPPAYEARRSGSGPQYPVEDEIAVEEETVRSPRRRERDYERKQYPIVIEDISVPLEDHRPRAASRAPPPPPSGFSSNRGGGGRGYRRDRSSESGSDSGSASDSGFDEARDARDGNLKGRRDRDREVHRLYQRGEGKRERRD